MYKKRNNKQKRSRQTYLFHEVQSAPEADRPPTRNSHEKQKDHPSELLF